MAAVFLAVLTAYDVPNADEISLYVGEKGVVTGASDTPAHTAFLERLLRVPDVRRDMFTAGATLGRAEVSVGELEIANGDGALDGWLDYAWDGRTVTVYFGEEGAAFPGGWTTAFVGRAEQLEATRDTLVLKLRDPLADLDQPLQRNTYAGDNVLPDGLEGVGDLKGKFKPQVYGSVRNIQPVWVNTAKLILQAHDGPLTEISDVRDKGISLNASLSQWTDRQTPTANGLYAVAHNGAGLYIAGGGSGTLIRSTDYGVTWSFVTTASFGTDRIEGIAHDPDSDVWVACGVNKSIANSTDGGEVFTQQSNPLLAGEVYRDVAYGNSQFIAVGGGDGLTDRISRSTDGGVTWDALSSPFSNQWVSGVTYSPDLLRWVVVSDSGEVAYSDDDGDTWTRVVTEFTTYDFFKVHWARDRFVASADGLIATSLDGITWTQRLVAAGESLRGVGYGGPTAAFVIGGNQDTEGSVYASVDGGVTWTRFTTTFGSSVIRGVSADDTHMVIVGEDGKVATLAVIQDYATEDDLLDDSQAPPPGGYSTYLAGGMIRLGSPPDGQVTMDCKSGDTDADRTAAQLWVDVLQKAGKTSGDWSASDVTTLDGLNAAVCGAFVGTGEKQAATLLSFFAQSVGARWGADSTGVFRIKRVDDARADASVATYVEDEIRGLERISTQDRRGGLPVYETVVKFNRNYTVQRGTQLAGGVTEADRADWAEAWSSETHTDTAVRDAHKYARRLEIETALTTAAAATAEALRQGSLRDALTHRYIMPVPLTEAALAVEIGDVITLEYPRFGFDTGDVVRVLSIDPDSRNRLIRLGVWYHPLSYPARAKGVATVSAIPVVERAPSAAAAGVGKAVVTLEKA